MRVRIPGTAGTAALAAGLVALAAPQAAARPDPGPSAAPRLLGTEAPSLPLHRAARPSGPSTATRRATVNVPSCSTSDLVTAINTVNATGGTVNLFPGCTYTLTSADNDNNGLPVITSTMTINGFNDTITRSSSASLFRIFEVDAPGNLTLNRLTLSNGRVPNIGGAILVNGATSELTLNASSVINNTAATIGGGVFANNGTVTVNTSTLSGNTAARGGGLEADGGSLVFNTSTITNNTATVTFGGGVVSVLNTATFNATRIVNNTGPIGGGIAVAGDTTLNNSTVTGNTATTGIVPLGGGGIYNEARPLTLNASPVNNNHATGTGSRGGGIFNRFAGAVATLRNSRVSSNTAADNAGGIYNAGGTVNLIPLNSVVNNLPNNCVTSTPAIPGCPN